MESIFPGGPYSTEMKHTELKDLALCYLGHGKSEYLCSAVLEFADPYFQTESLCDESCSFEEIADQFDSLKEILE